MNILDAESKSLLQVGFIRKLDVVILLSELALFMIGAGWAISGRMTGLQAIFCMLVLLTLQSFWILSVAYRANYFILKMRASIETLPQTAAKIAIYHIEHASQMPEGSTSKTNPLG